MDRLYPDGKYSYVFHLSFDVYIDGANEQTSNVFRYINDPRNSDYIANVRFNTSGGMVLTRNVKAGSELFVHYGARYWGSTSQPKCGSLFNS